MKTTSKVDGRPAMQFYPDDWLSSEDLCLVSLAAQGLWIHLLCRMWKSSKRGILLKTNGKKPMAKDIAKWVGVSKKEIETLLAELVDEGVCSTTDGGEVYCRRMFREWEFRDKRAEAGRRGAESRWHGTLDGKTMANHGPPTPTPSPAPTSVERGGAQNGALFSEEEVPKKKKPGSNIPPKPEEVTAYAATIEFTLDGAHFCDYHERQGWRLSNGRPMKNWQATVRTWKHKDKERNGTGARMAKASDFKNESKEAKEARARKTKAHNQRVRDKRKADLAREAGRTTPAD